MSDKEKLIQTGLFPERHIDRIRRELDEAEKVIETEKKELENVLKSFSKNNIEVDLVGKKFIFC